MLNKQPRFTFLSYEQTQGAARRLADRVVNVSSAGVGGPFNLLLKVPATGELVVNLLDHFNGGFSLVPARIRRLAQLTLARQSRASYAWWTHSRKALASGEFTTEEIEALIEQRCPASFDEPLVACWEYVRALSAGTPTPQPVLQRVKAALGEQVVADLLLLCGTYQIVAMILNEAEVSIPHGEADPFLSS